MRRYQRETGKRALWHPAEHLMIYGLTSSPLAEARIHMNLEMEATMSIRAEGEKWTAGPWQASNLWLGPKGMGPYAYPLGTDPDIAAANARLIAAAPEQNNALVVALDTLSNIADEGIDMNTFNLGGIGYEAIQIINSALAKARGEG